MFHVYVIATGNLVSSTSVEPLGLDASMAYKSFIDGYEIGKSWNTTTLDFDLVSIRVITKTDFINRFTQAELKEMFGFRIGTTYTDSQQKNISSFMRFLDFNDEIDLDNTMINNGVNYLETVGILGAGRAAEALSDG